MALQVVGFETVGRTAAWTAAFRAFGSLPASAVVLAGIAIGVALTSAGWILPARLTKHKREGAIGSLANAVSAPLG